MSKGTLIKGASVLAVAGIITKIMGAVFRLPLVNWIGDTGMANYSPAYYIYAFLVILATSGLPVAISKLVSESVAVGNHYQAHRVFRISTMLMTGMGAVFFLVLFIFAPQIAELMGNRDAALGMRAISPSLLLVPLMAAFRGYFQGMQNMKPTAISQVAEQFFRVVIGLGAAYILFFHVTPGFLGYDSYALGASGANLGATAGSLGGLLMILFVYVLAKKQLARKIRKSRHKGAADTKIILNKILIIAVPITIGAAIYPILNLIDSALVMNRLMDGAGFSHDVAKGLYGQLSGFVGSLINFPQLLSQSVAVSLVPLIAAAYKLGRKDDLEENVFMGLRMASIIGYPCAFGLMALAEPVLLLLYPSQAESASNAAPILTIMAFGLLFLVETQTITGILQGVGKPMIPVLNMLAGMVVKIVVTWVLVGIPSINVNGAAIGSASAFALTMILNFRYLSKYTGIHINKRMAFAKPFAAAFGMGVCVKVLYMLMIKVIHHNSIVTLICVAAGVVLYVVFIFRSRSITKEELAMMPKGDKLIKIAGRFIK